MIHSSDILIPHMDSAARSLASITEAKTKQPLMVEQMSMCDLHITHHCMSNCKVVLVQCSVYPLMLAPSCVLGPELAALGVALSRKL